MIEQCTQRNVAQEKAYAELTKLNKDQVAKAKKKALLPPHAYECIIYCLQVILCARTAIAVLKFSNTGNITRFIKLQQHISSHWALRPCSQDDSGL